MRRILPAYLLTLLIFGSAICLIIFAGRRLESPKPDPAAAAGTNASLALTNAPTAPTAVSPAPSTAGNGAWQTIRENLNEPLSRLLIQLVLIVVLARLFGWVAQKLGQPAVIGEMLAGIFLGPSLVGSLFPHAFQFVFPPESLGALRILSQVGVILFMFAVGLEVDGQHLRGNAPAAIMVSHVSIIFPYFLGVGLSYLIFRACAGPGASFAAFAMFMGIATSITAFPVLARILADRGMTRSSLGQTALTCAAIGDVTAWVILAFVVAMAKASSLASSALTILLVLVFVVMMVFAGRPLLKRLTHSAVESNKPPGSGAMVGILVLVFCSALVTEVAGIHALFGAFLAGTIMPANARFRAALNERIESFSSGFLLPLYFAFTGLRTQAGLLSDWESAGIFLAVFAAANIGKLGGTMVTARCTGMNWNDSFALGALMNTRGLVELIVLNIGYDLGILPARVFAMMVIMALATTCMTGPLLTLAERLKPFAFAKAVAERER